MLAVTAAALLAVFGGGVLAGWAIGSSRSDAGGRTLRRRSLVDVSR